MKDSCSAHQVLPSFIFIVSPQLSIVGFKAKIIQINGELSGSGASCNTIDYGIWLSFPQHITSKGKSYIGRACRYNHNRIGHIPSAIWTVWDFVFSADADETWI
jgi:hypothetical protein